MFPGDFLCFLSLDCKSNWVTISFSLCLSQQKIASVGEFSTERRFEGMSSLTNNVTPSPLLFHSTL